MIRIYAGARTTAGLAMVRIDLLATAPADFSGLALTCKLRLDGSGLGGFAVLSLTTAASAAAPFRDANRWQRR